MLERPAPRPDAEAADAVRDRAGGCSGATTLQRRPLLWRLSGARTRSRNRFRLADGIQPPDHAGRAGCGGHPRSRSRRGKLPGVPMGGPGPSASGGLTACLRERWLRPLRVWAPSCPVVRPPLPPHIDVVGDAPCFRPHLGHLVACKPSLSHTLFQDLVVLQAPRAIDRHHDVELQVLSVVASRSPSEGLLEIDVPTGEVAVRPRPEDPNRVRLVGSLQHQDAMVFPGAVCVPRVEAVRCWPIAGRKPKVLLQRCTYRASRDHPARR